MQPIVRPLSLWRRKLVFTTLLIAFLLSLPAFIFYATGYRYDFTSKAVVFTITGGFYVLADAPDSKIYIDDVEVNNARTFRSASYIQGLLPGKHKVHVQAPGLHTWVKELEVYPHIVTEVDSFNLPVVPQIRLISEYNNARGVSVVFPKASTTPVLTGLASTSEYVVASSAATTTFSVNQEFELLAKLFSEKASTTLSIKSAQSQKVSNQFSFATSSNAEEIVEVATTTVVKNNLRLYEREGEVYVDLVDPDRDNIPYYFCEVPTLIEEVLVENKNDKIIPVDAVITAPTSTEACRKEIKIDRKGETVIGFDFHPSDPNLVLMQLQSGLYVVEIDDRSWQNTQLLYPGANLEFILYRGGVFIKQEKLIFEVLLEIPS